MGSPQGCSPSSTCWYPEKCRDTNAVLPMCLSTAEHKRDSELSTLLIQGSSAHLPSHFTGDFMLLLGELCQLATEALEGFYRLKRK